MRTIALLLLLTSAAWSAQQEVSRNFDKTVPLGAGQRLLIEHQFGDVTVRGGPQKDVIVHAVLRVASSDPTEAERMLNEIQIQVEQTAAGVSVRTRYPDQNRMKRGNRSFSVSYTITAPEGAPLEIQNSFGPVVIAEMKGGTRVRNSHGRLAFRGGQGTQVFDNSFGALEVAGNQGDVTANNGNGSVRVTDVSGAVNVRSSFGGVVVERAGGNVVVTNGNGGIEVTPITQVDLNLVSISVDNLFRQARSRLDKVEPRAQFIR